MSKSVFGYQYYMDRHGNVIDAEDVAKLFAEDDKRIHDLEFVCRRVLADYRERGMTRANPTYQLVLETLTKTEG